MSDKTYSRKEFLNIFRRKEGNKETAKEESNTNAEALSEEKEEFLNEYILWLKEFETFVAHRSENTFDIEQNKKIMQIAAKIEEKKAQLQTYMKDPLFAKKFEALSSNITQKI